MKRIAVLGLGLIGGSFALALRQAKLAEHIAGYDVDPETTRRAKERGAITHVSATAMEVVRQADLVILATPILALPELFKRIAPALTPGTLVTDVASTRHRWSHGPTGSCLHTAYSLVGIPWQVVSVQALRQLRWGCLQAARIA